MRHGKAVEDPTDEGIEVDRPRTWAGGVPAVLHAMDHALRGMGVRRSLTLLTTMNQKDGFDCMSCAWPDPSGHRAVAEFCENGAKAVAWEATPVTVSPQFWAEHSVDDLASRSEYWLGQQGRLMEPVYKAPGEDHYRPVSWDEAFALAADALNGLDSPDQASFYTSGRASNEAAFLYQLFVRAYGTNNLPDCSNMCHESTSSAMAETIGLGKATVTYDDFAKADLIVIMGQNPGTNHPRMLTALEGAKQAGATILAVNPLPEAGLKRFKHPQKARGVLGRGTQIADVFLQIRVGGDLALFQALNLLLLQAEDAAPGTVLDHDFLEAHTQGLDELRAHLAGLDEEAVLAATGLTRDELDQFARHFLRSERVIVTWAMGLTQHADAVSTIREIINLLLLRGHIGRPGAGACPIRGHSNVQGDRTMGIWERMPDTFLDALRDEFGFEPPREHGLDSVDTVRAMQRGDVRFFMALGGNFVSAISDTEAAKAALRGTAMTVQVSTKLNRSHGVTGEAALILPTLGRTEIDRQAAGEQFVTVEDTVCAVHASHGQVEPVGRNLLSEIAIVSRLATATLGDRVPIDWRGFEADYRTIRRHISRVVPGCEDYERKVTAPGGFVLPHGPRDSRTFATPSGRALLTANSYTPIAVPPGRLLLQTIRAHDQFNTTIYSRNDRYRGVKDGREIVLVHPEDLAERGLADGDAIDVFSEWPGEPDRELRGFRAVAYPTARGCAAAYYPEANVLVPLGSTAKGSNTPVSKAVVVRIERAAERGPDRR